MVYRLGIDAGSTTVKLVLLDEENKIIYKCYTRHLTKVRETVLSELSKIKDIVNNNKIQVSITGSSGYGLAMDSEISFVQEVFATTIGVKKLFNNIDVVIELGGEDAKIIYLTNGLEERMNSSCAGGTGAFIDQMASLMGISVEYLDKISFDYKNIYPIASRCGVFAKSDIQPLLNQGASKADIAVSIYDAVVNQTIGGLAQGREIKGNILFLGGPLYFYKGLRSMFIKKLNLSEKEALVPEDAEVFVAKGAALFAGNEEKTYTYKDLLSKLNNHKNNININKSIKPLFSSKDEYNRFLDRHNKAKVLIKDINDYIGDAYLGIDAGSTTTKLVLIDYNSNIIYQFYAHNEGNPVKVIKRQLEYIYDNFGDKIIIKGSAVTGYGEELIKKAFGIDYGIVETLAHYIAASKFNPGVDFILDIGGQDIKCFEIENNAIKSIILNEACSSGCGSFIETFAKAMGYDVESFSKLGLFAKHPADLGSRCTVFMNSSIKQAQRDGATIEDVSAGLSISVVKNALYKVIRTKNIGKNVIVQGGTLCNDAILRSLEIELNQNVIRSNISGLMGAYGAAIYSKREKPKESKIISRKDLENFTHSSKGIKCGLCTNKCNLTINTFNGGRKYISGNRCSKPTGKYDDNNIPNLYEYKYLKLLEYANNFGDKGVISIPMVLNMYENLPFFVKFFNYLGIKVVLSDASSKKLYLKGQHTIPSDTACYPAKIVHGHIESIIEKNIENIFYPCMTFNYDEGISDNHYNCPVVAYYPEVIKNNVQNIEKCNFISPYLDLNSKKSTIENLYKSLIDYYPWISKEDIKHAYEVGLKEYKDFKKDILIKGKEAIEYGRDNDLLIVVLTGRPYHIDKEINHGIDRMMNSLNLVILTEDSIPFNYDNVAVNVLNQWTYQARLFNAAKFVVNNEDMQLVQLVSFGCGTDAITADEIKSILESKGKIYTQLKIDETNNLGAAKIRIRSMVEAVKNRWEVYE
ncbi:MULTISPECIES: acyl-CoA dehydratase activase [unclassified Clostridium]|uniref:acyl-CoA dehydratase activase n=2 Tax=Clostridium TaxID=1485 RepID=UPI0025BE6578|nr:acyl-CoA dehydratase activase [Clostridium sp.]MDY2632270.1 acyl-CoA dehydratase activase [Clostridium sp.]MDY4253402.1 acyl-CoA dehydratase activase [Clostridium sp.]MDY6228721.1 acyl-CoA dehydratase activase [Clostridium sp.]